MTTPTGTPAPTPQPTGTVHRPPRRTTFASSLRQRHHVLRAGSIGLLTLSLILSRPGTALPRDVVTPVAYTTALLAVEFVALNLLDLNDNSISYDNFEQVLDNPSPREDDDDDVLNLVLHPLMGSETYLRAREGDFGIPGSIAFSLAASLTWEYGLESWTEHPSSKDILLTTGIGWMIGEVRYQIKRYAIDHGDSYFWVDPIWATLEYLDLRINHDEDGVTTIFGWKIPL
ncbi:DUF3943 domain-containing protein [Desulfofustis limnaeus]|jgi:hypothetical protein|uniref:DUF3943 domain-containing protein n=1 Tax=Desulfofustis limnaeus TaxID=2740163 RepID=A0ABM7W655_9BACT|nr:DUF3943 domain-containing protein [Desulfofustis limnaeus]MDX9895256.1 DUF3943 domain-containing protein [Desulfofustis sp.]BDD86390.1 hypothetical protein DPPLL_07550 [Desulfofustis limnaeus]